MPWSGRTFGHFDLLLSGKMAVLVESYSLKDCRMRLAFEIHQPVRCSIFALGLLSAWLVMPLHGEDAESSKAVTGDDGFHLLTLMNPDGLTLLSVPSSANGDEAVTSRSIGIPVNPAMTRFVGVAQGHLICLPSHPYPARIAAIDLNDGTVRELTKRYTHEVALAGDNLYFVVSVPKDADGLNFALMHIDLTTMATSQLGTLNARSPRMAMSGGPKFVLAPNSSGNRIAVVEFEPTRENANIFGTPLSAQEHADLECPKTRLLIANARTRVVRRMTTTFPSRYFGTGGWTYQLPPSVGWYDDERLVVAMLDERFVPKFETRDDGTTVQTPNATQDTSVYFGEFGARTPLELVTVDANSLEEVSRFRLPNCSAQVGDPRFSHKPDGSTLIHLGQLGPYRVDLEKSVVVEDSEMNSDYTLAGSRPGFELSYRDEVLSSKTLPQKVFASPDGRHVAWLPSDIAALGYIDSMRVVDMKVHTAGVGIRQLARANFPRQRVRSNFDKAHLMIWCDDDDLVVTERFRKLPEFDFPKPKPRVDERPAIAECVKIELSTDKSEYLRHEPIELTITVTNLTDEDVSFESTKALGGTQPFNSLEVKAQTGRTSLNWFEAGVYEPEGDTIVFPAGEPVVFRRQFDVGRVGSQEFKLRFERWSKWSGSLIVKAPITVLEESTNPIFYAKFDRILAVCQKQFEETGYVSHATDFWQMGEEAATLLVKAIRESDDPEFCKHLGRSLRGVANFDTLPMLEEMLHGELKIQPYDYIASLWRLCRWHEPADETLRVCLAARDFVFEAALHKNAGLAAAAMGQLTSWVDPQIDVFMWRAVDATNSATATTAARYIARRRQLSLSDWFSQAAAKPTSANSLAAVSIIEQLRKTWGQEVGSLPAGLVLDATNNAASEEAYRSTLVDWRAWAEAHPRLSESFFEKERENSLRVAKRYRLWGDADQPPAIIVPAEQ